MTQHFKQAKNLIDKSNSILLTMHERMDGDDGGSILSLYHQLTKMEKNVEMAIKKGVPKSLSFLPASERITDDINHKNFDLLITCGCSELKRTGSENIVSLKNNVPSLKIINIDHHPDNKLFGNINLVDSEKSSVAELVYDFFKFSGWRITPQAATCLLTGIITDTGSFRHSNTKSSTLKAAAELLKAGGQLNLIIKHTYKNKSPRALLAWGEAFKNTYYDKLNQIIYAILTEEDLKKIDSDLPKNVFEGFVETLNTVPSAKFAMLIKQDGNVIKASLRSEQKKGVNVSEIAQIFGGGGHKLAAGFSLVGKLVKDEGGKWKVQ